MSLPGLPGTKKGILLLADRALWNFVEVKGHGGVRREYAPPAEVMSVIQSKAAQEVVTAIARRNIALRPEDQLPLIETDNQALVTDARKGVLLALETLMNRSGYPMKKAARVMLEMARTGEASPQLINMLKMARDGRGRPSADGLPALRSVIRFAEYGRNGVLAPRKPSRDMSVPAWAPTFMECYQRPEKPTVEHAYRVFSSLAAERGMDKLPSVWQVRRFLGKVGKVTLETGRMGDRELKSLKPFIRRDFKHLLPTDVYSADGHTFDAEVQHPLHGRPFRPEITSVIDIATRRVVGWSVDLAESGIAVLDALRTASMVGGIPAIFYVDNGSGYKNRLMTDSATGLMARLGIEMVNSLPYNSQARGVIERLHQTLWVNAAKQIPGYMGRDMDRQAMQGVFKLSRKALAARKDGQVEVMPLMGWPGFLEFCNLKVSEYNSRPHSSLPKIEDPETGRRRYMTPDEAWAKAVAEGFAAHTVTDDEARPLFRPQELRTVRRCELELFGNRYFSRALEELHTEQVRVGYDIHDPATVWVYDADGRFICTAGLNANQRDYMPKSMVERARDRRAAGREKRLEEKLTEVRLERHGLPALEQMEQITIPGFLSINRSQLAERASQAVLIDVTEHRAPFAAPAESEMPMPVSEPQVWTVPETAQGRYDEWLKLNELTEEEIESEKQKKWRQTYQATAEFRAYQRKTA
ncbi:transposase [Massilia sp. NR 4-1]|nr:transposase [Massilia sp. NR 4-1]